LGFLKRIAGDYGYVFSVRDSQLIFTDVFEIEKAGVVTKIDRTQIVSYSVKDSTKDTAASAAVSYSDPDSAEEVDFEYSEDQLEGYGVQDDFSDGARSFGKSDRFKVEKRVENTQQAERVAKTALHSANSRQVTANLEIPGDPKLMAGANIELTGMRKHSGKYQLQQVSHTFSRSGGYTCSLDCNKIGSLTNSSDEIPLNER
jgi:phage protein D